MPTTIVNVFMLACKGIEVKRKNATVSDRRTNLAVQLVNTRAVGRTMRDQIMAAEYRINTLKAQLADARLVHKKLVDESFRTAVDLCAKVVAAEESLDAKKARVWRLEHVLATVDEKRQQFLAER